MPAPDAAAPSQGSLTPRELRVEIIVVLWVSLGAAAVRAALNLINRLTSGIPLNEQSTTIVAPVTPDRPWLDIAYQVAGIVLALGPVALVIYLLHRSGDSLRTIGVDASQPRRDLWRGAALAAVVGGTGLVFYLLAHRAGLTVGISAAQVSGGWWEWPLLLCQALMNSVLEEIVILGYLLLRLSQLGVSAGWAIAISAVLRATYHLYQGFGGFIGNLVMGVLFGWLFLRWRRAMPMIVAHFLIDAVAFVGYAALAGRVDWLP